MKLRVVQTDLHVLNMQTRMPFKYGIATLTALPHLFVRVELDIDGQRQWGIAADGLPPKWFTKDPTTTFADDLKDMMRVIRSACALAAEAGSTETVFDLWRNIYNAQEKKEGAAAPPLLWNFGVSLAERAIIDAFCRATKQTIASAVRNNTLGIHLGNLHPELGGATPADLLPATSQRSIKIRHTVGLADPLTDADIAPNEAANDGLPQSLESCIRTYGLTHFKIKLVGDAARDFDRLKRIESILRTHCPNYAFTLDGNEQYKELGPFKDLWQSLTSNPALKEFLSHLIFVEQPLHRDVALSDGARTALLAWTDRPPMIIDESDATLVSLPDALASGYVGASHKNCKGIFKGIANACLIEHRKRTEPNRSYVLSAEDLANVGPVALLQDLAVLALLGIDHAERNGHHYFKGLSAFPQPIQQQLLKHHFDLYRKHEDGFATLNIRDGAIDVGSVVDAPFGLGVELSPVTFPVATAELQGPWT
jgi:hypothetical protein